MFNKNKRYVYIIQEIGNATENNITTYDILYVGSSRRRTQTTIGRLMKKNKTHKDLFLIQIELNALYEDDPTTFRKVTKLN